MKIMRNDKSKSKKNARYSDGAMTRGTTNGLGMSIVALTLVVSIVGVHTSIEAMQVHAMQMRYVYQQEMMNHQGQQQHAVPSKPVATEPVVPEATEPSTSVVDPTEMHDWTSAQVEWMLENHITWNEFGLPVNELGEVVDDPTTAIDETERALELMPSEQEKPDTQEPPVETNPTETTAPSEPSDSETDDDIIINTDTTTDSESELDSSETALDTADRWWDSVDMMIFVDENGHPYYLVESGDCMGDIADASGFTVKELVDYNHFSNADVISIDQKIMFPLHAPNSANN